jgi:hypothetical protein
MSELNRPKFIGTEDPEDYAELFCEANRRPPSDEQSPPGDPRERRLQTVLDAVADISLCQRGNVSATMACLKVDKGTLETRLYVVFNHENDDAARRCPQHLQVIFDMLRRVPYNPPAIGSPNVIANEIENDFIEICKVIHDYSFDIFAHRVTKHEHELSDIRRYIKQDRAHFRPQQRATLMEFLEDVDMIITSVVKLKTTKQLPTDFIKILQAFYSYWTSHDLLSEDSLDGKKVTLLDDADAWLAESA